jgi:2-polyprenyl-3-methyl-5-hydroxy-6-metoxy-1,4-benzoquinol methylase
MSRIVERREKLDYGRVREFFARRSGRIKELGLLSVTMYQDEDLARKRDAYEKETVLPHFGMLDRSRVLDIGCGTGRWGDALGTKVAGYLGTDFCKAYVEAAQARFVSAGMPEATHSFQQLAAQQVSAATLAISPPFDIVIIAGLMTFLNDEDVIALLSTIHQLTREGSLIYIREPIGVEHRLTLKEHFSEELGEYYHAIYRKVAEYESFFREALPGFTIIVSRALFPDELCNRKETAQHIFFMRAPKHDEGK